MLLLLTRTQEVTTMFVASASVVASPEPANEITAELIVSPLGIDEVSKTKWRRDIAFVPATLRPLKSAVASVVDTDEALALVTVDVHVAVSERFVLPSTLTAPPDPASGKKVVVAILF